MMRRKGVASLTVWAVMSAVIFAPPAGACVWCDSAQWLNFQDCLYSRMRNEPTFGQVPVGALDDMRNSITAASQAITKGSSSMKMKMLVGAMAGEMSELIKPMSSPADAKAILMSTVQGCNVDVIGRPDLSFIDELSRTLEFMMNEPSYDNPESIPNNNNAFPQNAIQSFTSPTNFNGQNINNSPPDFNNMRQLQPQTQLPPAGVIMNNAASYQGNNQLAPSGIAFPNNQNAGSRFPTQAVPGQGDINAASLSYPSQPQIMNANGANGFNTFNQNPPINPSITNANAASSANSYNLASTNTISNTDQNIPQNNIQNQFPPRDFFPINNQVPSYPTNNFQNQQFRSQSINQPQRGSEAKTFEINSQNVPQNNQENQFNQYSVSNGNGLGQSGSNIQRQTDQNNVGTSPYNELPPNYDYWFPNQNYPNSPVANTPYGPSSGSSVVTNSNSQERGNYPEATNKTPKNGKKFKNRARGLKKPQNKINGGTNQKSLQPSPNDDDVARAMRFVETCYVILSQSNDFKSVFNEQIPNDQALSVVYTIDVGALNDCGYSRFSVEIANACTVVIQSLPDGCSFVQYAEALSKALMNQLNIKKLIGENPEGQAKCIANNLLKRLNQKISLVMTTTTMQPPLATDSESTFFQGPGSQPQVTNANSGSYSYSSYQNPNNQPQLMNNNVAIINRPNTDQNNLQNQFLQGNNVPINNAVPGNFLNEPQNQLNFAPGPMNQRPDSSAIATNKNITPNPNLQNMDRAYNEDGIKNAAIIFYQKLSYDLLASPYMSRIYNEKTTKTNAKTNTASLLVGSLSADYDNLATEIARECIRRLGLVQTGSNTEAYTTLIATCITDGFLYYGLISQETPSAQASDISSKIIDWLKGDSNNGNNNQQANRNNAQSNLPNQGARDYPNSYSGVPDLSQWPQSASSEASVSNSGGIIDYNPNTDNLAQQYLQYDYQNFDSNSPPITNDGLQNIRTTSNANNSSVKTNSNKGKKKKAIKNNKKNSKKTKKKKQAVSKTNFNYDNLNDYYRYNDYPVNNAAKNKPNSPTDISNGDYFRDYNDNLNYQPNNVPNTQLPGFQNYPTQNVNQDYDLSAGAAKIQNDNISGPQQSAFSPAVNNSPGRKKHKNFKNRKGKNAANKPLVSDDQDASNYPSNQRVPSALDMTNNPQTFQSNKYTGPPSNDYDAITYQNTPPVSSQSQIIPDERNDEVKDRIRYLTKGVLSSMSSGKFDYRFFSDIIAEATENLQTIHPELGSQTSLIKTLIDSLIACTQLLSKVPPNYFDDIGVLQNSDIPDAAAIDYSNIISPIQGDQSIIQTNQNNVALNDQSYGSPNLPQQNNLNNDQIGNFYPGGSASLPNTNVPPPRQDYVNNVALNDPSYGPPTLQQQNNLNNDQTGQRNFYPGGSAPLPNNNVPPPRQGYVNTVALNDQSYGPPTVQQQNNLNNDQTGQRNFYPGGSDPLPNNNVPPPRQGYVNNIALNDQSYGPPTLPQQNNLNNDQTGQRNVYPGGSAPLPNTNVPSTRQDFGIQNPPQGVEGNGLSNAQTSRGISSQIRQDNSFPILLNGYGSQNLPLNNQNNLAFQPSGGFNNPNLQQGNMGNQNIQSGNSFQTMLPQANQMYDTNLPQSNQMLNLPGGPSQNLFS